MAFIGNTPTTQAFTPAVDYFSGNASTTAFTLSRPVASVAQVQVVVNNVAQNPSSAYTISSNTITFTSAPSSGTNNIYVYYTSPITQVIAPSQATVGLTQLSASGTASSSTYLRGDNTWSAIATVSGALVRAPQILTSGTSYTTPSNCTRIYVECVGGGGGGGAGQNTLGGIGGGGGGGGGYTAKYFTVTGSTSYTYAIAAASSNASNGNSTTFTVSGVTITAGGGTAGANYGVGPQGNNGGSGGTASGGDINVSGNGGDAVSFNYSWVSAVGGAPAGFGGGAGNGSYYNNAPNGGNYGGGGGGGEGTAGASGTSGGQGVIRIWEYT